MGKLSLRAKYPMQNDILLSDKDFKSKGLRNKFRASMAKLQSSQPLKAIGYF